MQADDIVAGFVIAIAGKIQVAFTQTRRFHQFLPHPKVDSFLQEVLELQLGFVQNQPALSILFGGLCSNLQFKSMARLYHARFQQITFYDDLASIFHER